jgi:hypothetical protein
MGRRQEDAVRGAWGLNEKARQPIGNCRFRDWRTRFSQSDFGPRTQPIARDPLIKHPLYPERRMTWRPPQADAHCDRAGIHAAAEA